MEIVFISSDPELKHFTKQNALITGDSDTGKIRLVIEDSIIKFNKNILTKNFHFFQEKIHKEKNNKNECLNILNHIELFAKEDLEFLKNKFFYFINFLFSNINNEKIPRQNFKMKINEIIKFIEICIILEPKNLIIKKIKKIIFLNPKIKTAIEANSNKPDGKYIKDKFDFLKQKLLKLKYFCKSNPINKLEKADLRGFGLNASHISGISAKSHDHKSSLSNSSFNLNNCVNSGNNENLDFNKSEGKFCSLIAANQNECFFPKYKNSIFFRYSFNLIRHLYDLPLALHLKNKSAINNSNNNTNLNDSNNNFNLNNINLNTNTKKVSSYNSISNEKLKTLSSYNEPILEKRKVFHGQISYNKQQNEGGGGNTSGYLFGNSILEEETRNHFALKNKGFFAFVDSLFNNKNSLFAYWFKSGNKNKQESILRVIYGKKTKIGLLPNKNYIRNLSSLSSISEEFNSQFVLASNKNNINNNFIPKSNVIEKSKKPTKSIIKKSLENILLKEFTESNKELSRFFLNKNLQNFDLRCEKAILLQKHFRRYLAYKNYLLKIKNYLKYRLISSIEKIQAFYRSFIWRKKIKYKLLLEEILRSRLYGSIRIFFALRKFQNVKKFKQNFLILQIIQIRELACITIQTNFRGFSWRKFIKDFLCKENYFYKITYPFKAQRVQLKLYIPRPIDEKIVSFEIFSDEKILNFEFCNFRKIHVLYVDTSVIKPGKYRALMLVDGISTCDGRYPHVEFSDGFYYNIIDIKDNKNEEKKLHAQKNAKEKKQYYMNKYGFNSEKEKEAICFKKNLNDKNEFDLKNKNKIGLNNKSKNNFYSPLNKSKQAIGNIGNINIVTDYNSMNNLAAMWLNNFDSANNNKNYYINKENVFSAQGPEFSQFPSFISGANINSNLCNNYNNNPYAFTDSNNILNTEEQLETRNTWENQSYNSSKANSQISNNSNTDSKKYFRSKSNSSHNELINPYIPNDQKNNNINFNNFLNNEKEKNNFGNLNLNANRNIKKENIRQDSYNTFNSNLSNNEEYYFNKWIFNYNELKRNLLPNNYNTKTVSYMEKLRDCLREEPENFNEETSN
jgi:hypothetical protein